MAFLQKGTTPPPIEEKAQEASPSCSGDSKTALPKESQKDKRPIKAKRDIMVRILLCRAFARSMLGSAELSGERPWRPRAPLTG